VRYGIQRDVEGLRELYDKNELDDLSAKEKAMLHKLLKAELAARGEPRTRK